MHDWEARAKVLEAENDELRARIAELEEALGVATLPPPLFGLTSQEAVMFGVLLKTANPRKSTFMTALYSNEADDPPEEKIIDVFVCKMRKKLQPFGITIDTSWGEGFSMPEAWQNDPLLGPEMPRWFLGHGSQRRATCPKVPSEIHSFCGKVCANWGYVRSNRPKAAMPAPRSHNCNQTRHALFAPTVLPGATLPLLPLRLVGCRPTRRQAESRADEFRESVRLPDDGDLCSRVDVWLEVDVSSRT
jgi:hypothetical protein